MNTEVSRNINDLVAEAKSKLITGKPKATKDNTKAIEAPDAVLANELLAQRASLYESKKALEEQLKEIDNIIKDTIGDNDELHIYGAKVASISRWRETGLNSDVVKEKFPLAEFPELYKRSNKSRLNIH